MYVNPSYLCLSSLEGTPFTPRKLSCQFNFPCLPDAKAACESIILQKFRVQGVLTEIQARETGGAGQGALGKFKAQQNLRLCLDHKLKQPIQEQAKGSVRPDLLAYGT